MNKVGRDEDIIVFVGVCSLKLKSVLGFPWHTMFKSSMTSPRVLGKAIQSVGTENAAIYLQSLMLHGTMISIDLTQLDRGYPPQSLVAGT